MRWFFSLFLFFLPRLLLPLLLAHFQLNKTHHSVHISALALLKMAMHAKSGGDLEVMGMLAGRASGDAFVVLDAFALPVVGTETRVNAQAEANEYMIDFLETNKVRRRKKRKRKERGRELSEASVRRASESESEEVDSLLLLLLLLRLLLLLLLLLLLSLFLPVFSI